MGTISPALDVAPDPVQNALEALNAAKNAYQEAVRQFGTSAIRDGLNQVRTLLGVEKIRWVQYTPYFNDGEPCVFSVSGFQVPTADAGMADFTSYDEETGDDLYWSEFYVGREDESADRKAAYQITQKLGEMDDMFLAVFGDHVAVTFNGIDFTVEGYDHD